MADEVIKTGLEILESISDSSSIEKAIDSLKEKRIGESPKIEEIQKELDPAKHKIMDETHRPNKKVKADLEAGEVADAGTITVTKGNRKTSVAVRFEKVSRIALSYQSLIVSRAVAFIFGIPVAYNFEGEDETEKTIFDAVKKVLHYNKEKYFNREIARELFSYTEVAELWFPIEEKEKNSIYGFDTSFKLKCIALKPSEKNKLYPYFDNTGNLLAFSRGYTLKEDGKEVEYFDTYTDEKLYKFKKEESGWTVIEEKPNVIGKIPIVYARQEEVEWYRAQNLIESDEELRSNFSDTNKYHSSPTILAKGKVEGFGKKGEAGKLIQMDVNADAKYLEWSNASESVKTEHSMNREDIFALTQTPDISFNNVKSLGNLGVAAQKMLFMDAHLKVMDKEEILGEYLQRRINLILAFLANMNTTWKGNVENVIITPEITPYIMGDHKETVSNVTSAVSAGIMSRKTGIEQLGIVADSEAELQQIQDEELKANSINLFPSGV